MFYLRILIAALAASLAIAAAGPAAAYTVSGHVECDVAESSPGQKWVPAALSVGGQKVEATRVKVYEVDPVPGGLYAVDFLGSAVLDTKGDFTLTVADPGTAGAGFEVGAPDLMFELVQFGTDTIYQERPADAHWNVAHKSSVTLTEISAPPAICVNPNAKPRPDKAPEKDLFLFTRIGVIDVADVDALGNVAASTGYARAQSLGFSGADSQLPFGATLDLIGWFGKDVAVDRYKLRYKCDVKPNAWTDVRTPLPNRWYDTSNSDQLKWRWVRESMGPYEELDTAGKPVENLYKLPYVERPNNAWSWLDRLGRFNTRLAADGTCRVQLLGYKMTGGRVEASPSIYPESYAKPAKVADLNYGEIVLRIDNTPPTVKILDVKVKGVSQPACGILKLTSTTDLRVDFRVRDPHGHLRDYALDALYGHSCRVDPKPAGAAQLFANPSSGNDYSVTYAKGGASYPKCPAGASSCTAACAKDVMPTCAYQFRLSAGKRTTNGYGRIYKYVTDTWHVTIQR